MLIKDFFFFFIFFLIVSLVQTIVHVGNGPFELLYPRWTSQYFCCIGKGAFNSIVYMFSSQKLRKLNYKCILYTDVDH